MRPSLLSTSLRLRAHYRMSRFQLRLTMNRNPNGVKIASYLGTLVRFRLISQLMITVMKKQLLSLFSLNHYHTKMVLMFYLH